MVHLLFPCLVLHLLAVPGGFKQPVRNVSPSDAEIGRFCNCVKLFFWILPHFTCLHCTRPFILGTPWRVRKVLRHDAVRASSLRITIRRTSSRLFRCVVFDCAFMSDWVCQWKPFWIPVEDSCKKAYLEEWVFISDAPSEGPSSVNQGDVIPETPWVSKLASSSP